MDEIFSQLKHLNIYILHKGAKIEKIKVKVGDILYRKIRVASISNNLK